MGGLRPWIQIPYDSTLSARHRFLFKNHFKLRDLGSDNSISINCALTHVCLLKDEWGRRKAPLLYSPREVSHDLTERARDAGLGPLTGRRGAEDVLLPEGRPANPPGPAGLTPGLNLVS